MKKRALFDSTRFWAALSVLLIGEFVALWLLNGDVCLWLNTWLSLAKTGLPSIAGTFGLMMLAVVLSRSMAGGLTSVIRSGGGGFEKTSFWLGRALAFFPMHAFAWSFVGLWIGRWSFPVWSLMPISEQLQSLSFTERLSREVWTWAPAIFLLSIPLMGQWMVVLSQPATPLESDERTPEEIEASLATPHLESPERIHGRPFKAFFLRTRNPVLLPAARAAPVVKGQPVALTNPVWSVGLLALILLFSIEDVLGLPGCMAKLVQALRVNDIQGAANPVLMLSCVAALGTLCSGSPVFMSPPTWRHALAWLLKGSAWCVVVGSLVAVTMGISVPLLPFVDSDAVFANPMAALWAGIPSMLCVLSLWLLGHMISPLNDSVNHV